MSSYQNIVNDTHSQTGGNDMSNHTLSLWAGLKMIIWRLFHPAKPDLFTMEAERLRKEKYEGKPETLNEEGE